MWCSPVWNLPLGGMSGGVSVSQNRTETRRLHKGLLLVGVAARRCLWRCLLTDKPTCHACHSPGPGRICHPCHILPGRSPAHSPGPCRCICPGRPGSRRHLHHSTAQRTAAGHVNTGWAHG